MSSTSSLISCLIRDCQCKSTGPALQALFTGRHRASSAVLAGLSCRPETQHPINDKEALQRLPPCGDVWYVCTASSTSSDQVTTSGHSTVTPLASDAMKLTHHIGSVQNNRLPVSWSGGNPHQFASPFPTWAVRGLATSRNVLQSNAGYEDRDTAASNRDNSEMQTEREGQTPAPGSRQVLAKVEPRIAMVYTCTKCDTRAVKTFSRRSYEKGLVMVQCPGCKNLHLVADHLGWFGNKGWTIQDLAHEKGTSVKVVNMPDHLPTSSSSTAQQHLQQQLSLEDWVGWSRVEELLSVAQPTTNQSQEAAQQEAGGSSQKTSSSDKKQQGQQEPGVERDGVNVDGVWEVGPQDLDRWRRVRDT